jgi:hypothetical protein
MMEAVRTFDTSFDKLFTRQYNPEDSSEHYIFLLSIWVYIGGNLEQRKEEDQSHLRYCTM